MSQIAKFALSGKKLTGSKKKTRGKIKYASTLKFLLRQGLRAGESLGTAVSSAFGADTIWDALVLILVEAPLAATNLANLVKHGGAMMKKVIGALSSFKDGPQGVEDGLQPIFDAIDKSATAKRAKASLCNSFTNLLDKIAGVAGSSIATAIPEDFGTARLVVYEAIVGAAHFFASSGFALFKSLFDLLPDIGKTLLTSVEALSKLFYSILDLIRKVLDKFSASGAVRIVAGKLRALLNAVRKRVPTLAKFVNRCIALAYGTLFVIAQCNKA